MNNKQINIKIDDELYFRFFEPGDEENLIKYGNNRLIWKKMRDSFPNPYTKKDATRWIRFSTEESRHVHLAIIYKNELIGAVGAELKDDIYKYSAELGYWLGEPFWGKGIATRVVKAAVKYIFDNYKINRLLAITFPNNPASNKVLLNNGFIKEGTLRKAAFKDCFFIDLESFGILENE